MKILLVLTFLLGGCVVEPYGAAYPGPSYQVAPSYGYSNYYRPYHPYHHNYYYR